MTGIDRLRAIAGAWDEWGLGGSLTEIADEIERDFADARMDHVSLMRILEVLTKMERHCLGHEGMEDSPVARWARELRGALKSDASDGPEAQSPSCVDAAETADVTSEAQKVTRDPAEDVSVSAYDLLSPDERNALAWVRSHGGLDHVKAEWRSRVPYDRYERRRQSLLGHIAECETALGRRREIISGLGHRVSDLTTENAELRRRAMPEGYEWLIEAWPKFEDDAPVKLGDMALIDGDVDMVEAVQIWIHGKPVIYGDNGSQQLEKGERVKLPFLAADGEPLEVGQTVWDVESGEELKVEELCNVGLVQLLTRDGVSRYVYPDDLTHTKPEIDSWQRIEEDVMADAKDYCESRGIISEYPKHSGKAKCEDIVRRCRALAERERGE